MAGSAGLVNYYAVLGVSRSASGEEIHAAYLCLAMEKLHADTVGKKEEEASASSFQQIKQAYRVLSDPTRRAAYDAGLYDPTLDNDDEEANMVMGLITDIEVNINFNNQQAPKKKAGSSSSSSPAAVRVDITFTNDGGSSSTTTVARASGGGSRASRRAGMASSNRRRRV